MQNVSRYQKMLLSDIKISIIWKVIGKFKKLFEKLYFDIKIYKTLSDIEN